MDLQQVQDELSRFRQGLAEAIGGKIVPTPVSPTWVGSAKTGAKYVLGVGIGVGACYLGFLQYRRWRDQGFVRAVIDSYEDRCAGDPVSSIVEDQLLAEELADQIEDDAQDTLDLLSDAPSVPGSVASDPDAAPRRRRRVPEVSYHRPYGADRETLRGAYIPRLVSHLRARNPSIPYTRANRMQIERMAYRLMQEHGMRAHDINRYIKRVALAVFFITDDDLFVRREEQVLRQENRLNMDMS